MFRFWLACALVVFSGAPQAETTISDAALRISVEELRSSVGRWKVVTEVMNADGSVAYAVDGTYEFGWVVPDPVVSGKSEMPRLQRAAAILFYINESKQRIEMVSVGADGNLWTMTGPLGGDRRYTQEFETTAGTTRQLRFTRFNVSRDAFESKMEFTDDGGRTWKPGNHQRFVRVP